jgi:putative tryptophan/tyrosine transport system substrate-binding protein
MVADQTLPNPTAGHESTRAVFSKAAADLPVQPPTKFEMVINLNTAKALGLEVPASALGGADEVIE